MTDEMKPVRCGCGGEANIHKDDGTFGQMPIYTVSCNTCGMRSGRRNTEDEAVTAWNRAMGEWIKEKENDAFCHCSTCGYMTVSVLSDRHYNFCPKCGADMRGD